MERKRRGTGDKIIVKGDSTKRPPDWKHFLSNDENKQQFIQILLDVWSKDSFAPRLKNRHVILTCEEEAFLLRSEDGETTSKTPVPTLHSSQEETDSRVVLYSAYAEEKGYTHVRVKSPDSDIFFILLHFALQLNNVVILFDTGTGNNKRLLNISEIAAGYTQQYCTALLSLHAFTGCDTTSAFKGLGKVRPIKALQKQPRFVQALAQLGDSWDIPDTLFDDLEAFTCAMYGKPRHSSVNDLRHEMIQVKCGIKDDKLDANQNVDMATIPPCRRTLEQHIRRCNFQVAVWKRAREQHPHVPDPRAGHGWTTGEDGCMIPLWTEDEEEVILPRELAEFLEELLDSDDEEDESCMVPGSEVIFYLFRRK